jgi:hypothetical protein
MLICVKSAPVPRNEDGIKEGGRDWISTEKLSA